MTDHSELYKKYADNDARLNIQEIEEALKSHIRQFNITITPQSIIVGKERNNINTMPIDRVCAIVEEPPYIYIILPGSMCIMNKLSGVVKYNIRG